MIFKGNLPNNIIRNTMIGYITTPTINYYGIGNRLNATHNDTGLVYYTIPLNQYTNIIRASAPSRENQYDLDGNMTATGDGWHYEWNGENRMVLASNDAARVGYAYDHRGRMIEKSISTAGAAADKTITYLWDDYNIIAETVVQGCVTSVTCNVWGLDLSGTMQGAGGIGGLLAVIRDGEPFFPCYDANGNITEYLDTNGVIVAHYEYDPFGNIIIESCSLAATFTHRFSTKPWCEVTGLSEYLFRKYSPPMGRWLSRDPIGDVAFLKLYVKTKRHESYQALYNQSMDHSYLFVKNASINKQDVIGLSIILLPGVILLESLLGLEFYIIGAILHNELCSATEVDEQWYFQVVDIFGNDLKLTSGEWVMIYVYKWKDKKCKIRCIIDINLIPANMGPGPLKPGPKNL